MREATRQKYDVFCLEFVANGRNAAKAAEQAGYSEKTARQQAAKLLKIPYICDKLLQLESVASDKAEEKFNITLEKRLKWLEQIVGTGLRETFDVQGNPKAENLQASTSAIKELNLMLGTDSHTEVKPVKVFVGVQDAS